VSLHALAWKPANLPLCQWARPPAPPGSLANARPRSCPGVSLWAVLLMLLPTPTPE
jgi:hypothetical protein